MAWITYRRGLPTEVRSSEGLVRSPRPELVLPHLTRLEQAFDIVLTNADEPEALVADMLGIAADGRPEILVTPYGGSHIGGVRKLPVADGSGKPLRTRLENRTYPEGVELMIDTPSARYHLLH